MVLRILIVTTLFFASIVPSFSTHIVGGELQLIWGGRGSSYYVYLRLYMDMANGSAAINVEPNGVVKIYRKVDHALMTEVPLARINSGLEQVDYNKDCSTPAGAMELNTVLARYIGTVNLPPDVYTHPDGYYMAYSTCCRNGIIQNIANPEATGFVFYLEFPPSWKNGALFRNSSPRFPLLGINTPRGNEPSEDIYFLCRGEMTSIDFSATDVDGDSLAYKMVSPMNDLSATMQCASCTSPGPYDDVIWLTGSGYNVNTQILGAPALTIDAETGIMTVRPTQNGLFVTGMVCEEYRDGVKIGEVRRDFQFQVVDCEPNYSPVILPTYQGNPVNPVQDVYLDEVKCIYLTIKDSSWNVFGYTENLTVTTRTNLPPTIYTYTPGGTLRLGTDSLTAQLCFDPCNKIFTESNLQYYFDIMVNDDGCPEPKKDTFSFTINILVPPNQKPEIGIVPDERTFSVYVGQTLTFDVYGTDDDVMDVMTLTGAGEGFVLADKNMSFGNITGSDSIASRFRFTPDCDEFHEATDYKVRFKLNDNSCFNTHDTSFVLTLKVLDAPTELPNISPPNLVTPNKDGLNDTFYVPAMPEDNCTFIFKGVEIYNTWGSRVYYNTSRDFKWDPSSLSDGMYYYRIDLNEKEFKGWIQVVR